MPPENTGSHKSDSRDATFRSIEAHLDNLAGLVNQLRDDLTTSCRDTDDILRGIVERITRVEVKTNELEAQPLDALPDRKPPPTLRDWLIAVGLASIGVGFLIAAVRGLIDLPSCIAAALKALKL